jgi:hypothetical protein
VAQHGREAQVNQTELVAGTAEMLCCGNREDQALAWEYLGNCVANNCEVNKVQVWNSSLFLGGWCVVHALELSPRIARAACMVIHALCVLGEEAAARMRRFWGELASPSLALSSLLRCVETDGEENVWARWIISSAHGFVDLWSLVGNDNDRVTFVEEILLHDDNPRMPPAICDMLLEDSPRRRLDHAVLLVVIKHAPELPLDRKLDITHAVVRHLQSTQTNLQPDLLRLLANVAMDCRPVQDCTRQAGGVHVVLNHCKLDPDRPMQREWALFALRNLCEGNEETQALIRNLKPVDYSSHPR